jgi:hypothetical protein
MQDLERFKGVDPGKKRFKYLVTRTFFYMVGIAMETASRIDPCVRKEVEGFPANFTFLMAAVDGPSMLMAKRDGEFKYLGEVSTYNADVELWFKSIEFAFGVMTGQISVPKAIYHNRQFVRGSLSLGMSMIRVLNTTQTLLLPDVVSQFYIKEVPPLTMEKIKNRGLTYLSIGRGLTRLTSLLNGGKMI